MPFFILIGVTTLQFKCTMQTYDSLFLSVSCGVTAVIIWNMQICLSYLSQSIFSSKAREKTPVSIIRYTIQPKCSAL